VLTLRKLLGVSPNHERAHRGLVQMLYYMGRYDDTLEVCVRGAGLAPGDPFYPFFTGKAYAQQGRTPEALKAFDECLKRQPSPAMSEEIDEFLKTVEHHQTEK
jgi:tetratricopeptide (TPR) repeat protein